MEALAFAAVNDPTFPNNYFLFTVVSTPFRSDESIHSKLLSSRTMIFSLPMASRLALGVPFNAGLDVDKPNSSFPAVTLPSVIPESVQRTIGI